MKAGTKLADVGGDAQVAGAREREPRARGGAVHRRDHRLLQRADREDVRVVALAQAPADVAGRLAELGQVLADAEAAPRAGEHDRAHLGVAGLLQRAASARCMSALNALRTSGRLSVIVRTAPSRLVSTSAIARTFADRAAR